MFRKDGRPMNIIGALMCQATFTRWPLRNLFHSFVLIATLTPRPIVRQLTSARCGGVEQLSNKLPLRFSEDSYQHRVTSWVLSTTVPSWTTFVQEPILRPHENGEMVGHNFAPPDVKRGRFVGYKANRIKVTLGTPLWSDAQLPSHAAVRARR